MAIIFVDNSGGVFEADLATGRTVLRADYTQTWTDIAVTPDGRVFANTFGELYELDLARAQSSLVASIDSGSNGLASDSDGNLYVGSGSSNMIEVLDGGSFARIDQIELPVGTGSSGDIHISGDILYFSSTAREVLTYDLKSDQLLGSADHGISALYGLQTENGDLLGLAGRTIYDLDPVTGEAFALMDLPISGSVYGAATLAGVRINGTTGNDVMSADIGGSVVFANSGRDILIGSDVTDRLSGQDGRDYLFGNGGRDRLDGGKGRDTLDGGRGADRLEGGFGRDSFVFEARDGKDTIVDFQNDFDQIELSTALLGRGAKTVDRLLSDFAQTDGADVILDFGRKGVIEIRDTTIGDIQDDILLF